MSLSRVSRSQFYPSQTTSMFRRADDTSHTYYGELVEEGWGVVVAGQHHLVLGVEGETYQTFSAGRGTVGDTSLFFVGGGRGDA